MVKYIKRIFGKKEFIMRKLLKYLKGYGKESVLGPLFKLLEASFELFVPLVVAAIIDTGIENGDKGYIVKMCLLLVALPAILALPMALYLGWRGWPLG